MNRGCCTPLLYESCNRPVPRSEPASELGALGGTRTPNLLIRRFLYLHPALFRSVRDVGLVSRLSRQVRSARRLFIRVAPSVAPGRGSLTVCFSGRTYPQVAMRTASVRVCRRPLTFGVGGWKTGRSRTARTWRGLARPGMTADPGGKYPAEQQSLRPPATYPLPDRYLRWPLPGALTASGQHGKRGKEEAA